MRACVLRHFRPARLLATPWTGAARLLCPRDSPGKKTGVGCHALLQGGFPTQGWNSRLLCLLHWRVLHCQGHPGSRSSSVDDVPGAEDRAATEKCVNWLLIISQWQRGEIFKKNPSENRRTALQGDPGDLTLSQRQGKNTPASRLSARASVLRKRQAKGTDLPWEQDF